MNISARISKYENVGSTVSKHFSIQSFSMIGQPYFQPAIAISQRKGRARGNFGRAVRESAGVVSILYRANVGYALHNGVPVPASLLLMLLLGRSLVYV